MHTFCLNFDGFPLIYISFYFISSLTISLRWSRQERGSHSYLHRRNKSGEIATGGTSPTCVLPQHHTQVCNEYRCDRVFCSSNSVQWRQYIVYIILLVAINYCMRCVFYGCSVFYGCILHVSRHEISLAWNLYWGMRGLHSFIQSSSVYTSLTHSYSWIAYTKDRPFYAIKAESRLFFVVAPVTVIFLTSLHRVKPFSSFRCAMT